MTSHVGWQMVLASLVLAFAIGIVIASVYTVTYHGVGYLRSFAQTIAMSALVSAFIMLAIGDDVARGLGMVGALTLVRFRTSLKDTRDLIFVFASLGLGVACGVQAFAVALIGGAMFSAASLYFAWSQFGTRKEFDLVLRFQAANDPEGEEAVHAVLRRHCRAISLIDLHATSDDGHEYAYHLKLARPGSEAALIRALGELPRVRDAAMFTRDATLEL